MSTFAVLNPATGALLAEVEESDAAAVEEAIVSARAAAPGWAALSPRRRGGYLKEVSRVLEQHGDELAHLESLENGKPERDARRFDVGYAVATFEYFGGMVETLTGQIIDQGPIEAHVVPEPYGVIGAILPFNWPPIHFAAKTAPAIGAGNTIVLKPGEQAPLTVLRMVELANEVLPPGVVTAVTGMPAGRMLAEHPRIDRLTFTGSPATGRSVMASAARNLTPSTMELGGKNALVVLEDADLEEAVAGAIEGLYFNQGEACTATARILLHESVYDAFAKRFAAATRALVVGEGVDARTDVGPMVDAAQRERVLGYIRSAHAEGAVLLATAELPDDEHLRGGFWVAPTLFGEVTAGMTIAREEVFGPVGALMRFHTDDEAVELANGTEFGLTAAVYSGSDERARAVARRLRAGMVFVNNYFRASLLGSPFGGIGASGFGREGAVETLHEFVRSKNIRYPSGRDEIPRWAGVERVLATSGTEGTHDE